MKYLTTKQLNMVQCPCCKANMEYTPDICIIRNGRYQFSCNPKVSCRKCDLNITIWGVEVADFQEYMAKLDRERAIAIIQLRQGKP